MTNTKRRKRGRPTGKESLDIDREITKRYFQNETPGFVIAETRLDKNTVYLRYKLLLEIAKEEDKKDFRKKYQEKISQYVLALDNLLNKMYKVLSYTELCMQKYMDKKNEIPEYLTQRFSELIKNIINIQKEKAAKELKIPLDEQIQDIIAEEVAKIGNR